MSHLCVTIGVGKMLVIIWIKFQSHRNWTVADQEARMGTEESLWDRLIVACTLDSLLESQH